jgi:ketosteroid isomerase-like protein
MTPGNRHVEAIALRCQAVLEAMRGRPDAAREILAAGRSTLEELGLALELHETAVHAGIVELLAGDAAAAAEHLRGARKGFEALGVAAGAAQAAALLARALVERGGKDDEALEQTLFAEEHGGEDLKTTITWCSARAEALARTGDFQQARDFAERGVALAEPTDALADKADASMALARVLLPAGRDDEAREAARAASGWYEAKGHVVGFERAARLAGGVPVAARGQPPAPTAEALGDRPSELVWSEFRRRFNAHDLDGVVELYAEDWVMVDHRRLGIEDTRGPSGVRELWSSAFASSSDIRFDVDLLASDDRVIAVGRTYRGTTSTEGGGEFELPLGLVTVVENGLLCSTDLYDPGDPQAMIARYAELGGGQARLGERPPERYLKAWIRAHAARDVAGLDAVTARGFALLDHRRLGWEQFGLSAGVAFHRSAWEVSEFEHLEVDEVLACADAVIAVRVTWRGLMRDGRGRYELPFAAVVALDDGRAISWDVYEPDDREAMLARFAELGGRSPVTLGDRPPERFWAEFKRRFDAHDADGLVALMDERRVLIDHRKLGWEAAEGPHETREGLVASFDASPDIRVELEEVLACDNRVIALRIAYRGHAVDGSGEFESPIGSVTVIEDGRLMRADRFEPEDRHAMIARYVEVGGGHGPLGDRPPERFSAEWGRRFARRELDRLTELHAEGIVYIDHRQLSWEEVRGRDRFAVLLRSGFDAFLDLRLEIDEVVACDDRVIALRQTLHGHAHEGGGEFAVPVGVVNVIEDGLLINVDQYEPDEREAVLARYTELGGRTSVTLGDRPPERWYAEYLPRHAARDVEAALELYTEDFVMVDHRVVGWEEVHGRDALRELYESVFRASPGIRAGVDEVLACDDRVIVTRIGYRGQGKLAGEFEDLAGYVTVIENGRAARIDLYDYDDEAAMVRRYHELGGYPVALGHRPPERHMARVTQRVAAGDLDGLMELYADDVSLSDHRALPWEDARGREALKRVYQSGFGTLPDMWMDVDEVLACDDRMIAQRFTLRAHALDGGGETALPVGSVNVFDGTRWKSIELFEPEDRQGMLGRFSELSAGADRPRAHELLVESMEVYNEHDLERLMAFYSEGSSFIDRRELGWEPAHGLAEIERFYRSAFAISLDIHQVLDEVLAADDRVAAVTTTMSGTGADGGGEFEYRFGYVTVFEEGLAVSQDFYDHDDRQALIARYAELGGGQGPLGDRPPERFWAEFCRRWATSDVDAIAELYGEDWESVEHRKLGWDNVRGREAAREFVASVFAAFAQMWLEVDEVLACEERVIALTVRARGFTEDGSLGETAYGQVDVVEDGAMVRLERFEPGDRDAMLARYEALRNGT